MIQGVSFDFKGAFLLVGITEAIQEDFQSRFPGYHKSRGEGLAVLCGVMLQTRSANLMELASALPRQIGTQDHRYQYISRLLANEHIDCDEIVGSYAREVFERLSVEGQTIVLMLRCPTVPLKMARKGIRATSTISTRF